jgi:hypothetical protein
MTDQASFMRRKAKVKGQWFVWMRNSFGIWSCFRCNWRGVIKDLRKGEGETMDDAYADLIRKTEGQAA